MPCFDSEYEEMLPAFCEHVLPYFDGQGVSEFRYNHGKTRDARYLHQADVVIFHYNERNVDRRESTQKKPLKDVGGDQIYRDLLQEGSVSFEYIAEELNLDDPRFTYRYEYFYQLLKQGYFRLDSEYNVHPIERIPVLESITAVELKRLRPGEGIDQATRAIESFANQAYVAVDEHHRDNMMSKLDKIEREGLGAIVVSPDGFEILHTPTNYVSQEHSKYTDMKAYHALKSHAGNSAPYYCKHILPIDENDLDRANIN